MPSARESLERILHGIKLETRRHRGRLHHLETEVLRKHSGFINRLYANRRASIFSELSELVAVLGVAPTSFYARHLGFNADPVTLLECLMPNNIKEKLPGRLLRIFEQRSLLGETEPLGSQDAATGHRLLLAELTAQPAAHRQVLLETMPVGLKTTPHATFLDHLDSLRYRDPIAAVTLTSAVARQVLEAQPTQPPGWQALFCRALGILASAYRQLGSLHAASFALREALRDARGWGLQGEEARLLERACYLLSDYGEPERALDLADHARNLYAEIPDLIGVAKVLVAQGLLLNQLGCTTAAARAFVQSIDHLPATLLRFRAAAFCGLAECREVSGDLDGATQALDEAAKLVDSAESFNVACVHLRRGSIELKRGSLEQAELELRRAKKLFTGLNPYDAALGSLDLLKILLLRGKTKEVRKIAAELSTLLKPLRKNKVAHAALCAVTRAAALGELTEAAVAEARLRVADTRRRAPARRKRR